MQEPVIPRTKNQLNNETTNKCNSFNFALEIKRLFKNENSIFNLQTDSGTNFESSKAPTMIKNAKR